MCGEAAGIPAEVLNERTEKMMEEFMKKLDVHQQTMFMYKLSGMAQYYADLLIDIDEVPFEDIIEDMKKLDVYPSID